MKLTDHTRKFLKKLLNFSFWFFIALVFGLTIWYVIVYYKNQNNQPISWVDTQFMHVWSIFQSFFIIIGLPLNFLKVYTTLRSLIKNQQTERKEMEKMMLLKKQKIKKYLEIQNQKNQEKEQQKNLSKKQKEIQTIQNLLKGKNVYLTQNEALEVLKIAEKTNNAASVIRYIFDVGRITLTNQEANNIIAEIKKIG